MCLSHLAAAVVLFDTRAHILVVDDDPDVRWITADDLRESGYIVTEADGGRAALAVLERDDPCDLMLVDLVMTGLTGVDTVRLVQRARPDLKVLFFSGYADLSRFSIPSIPVQSSRMT